MSAELNLSKNYLRRLIKEAGDIICLFFFYLLCSLCINFQPCLAEERILDYQTLSTDHIWLNQLHYRKTIFGRYQSEADGIGFFISNEGKSSPEAELRATVEVFLNSPEKPWGYIPQPVICAFPTRRKFLEEKAGLKFKDIPCPDYSEWKKAISGEKLYLIFSDAFPNNPASMFGHTFVLISKNDPPDSAQGLLDYSINFSADTSGADEKSLFYTLKGLFGGYKGRYRIYPFYQMINQYVNWDSRDLWYLKLPFNKTQIDRFLDHVWEIFTTTDFDYYFFDKNCSYRLLAALEYADPSLNLVNEFHFSLPFYYVSPIATYKAVFQYSGRIGTEYYSPSIQKSLENRIHQLSPEEQKKFHFLRKNPEKIKSETDIPVLDSLIAHFDYQKRVASSNYLPEEVLNNLDLTLRRRAELQLPSKQIKSVPQPPSPLNSHPTKAIYGYYQNIDSEQNFLFGGHFGYHDLFSPTPGFQKWSHLKFIDIQARHSNKETQIDSFTIANIISFFPLKPHETKPSWRAEGGYSHELGTYFKGGIGLSKEISQENNLLFIFINPILTNKSELTNKRGYFVEAELGLLHELVNHGKIGFFYKHFLMDPDWNFNQNHERAELRSSFYVNRNHEVRMTLAKQQQKDELTLGWQLNF